MTIRQGHVSDTIKDNLDVLLNRKNCSHSSTRLSRDQTINDWLSHNHLNRQKCLDILGNAEDGLEGNDNDSSERLVSLLSADVIWVFCYQSFAHSCPDLVSFARDVCLKSRKSLYLDSEKADSPVDIDLADKLFPFVNTLYSGNVSDMLSVAHEFGYAVQLSASLCCQGEEFSVPTVAKETCAFLSELFFIDFVREINPGLYFKLVAAWRNDDKKYLREDGYDLIKALNGDGTASYSYRWNYPLARLGAMALWSKAPQGLLAELFASGGGGNRYLPFDVMENDIAIP